MSAPQQANTTHPLPTVTVVGSINVDQVVRVHRHPSPGETLLGSSIAHTSGGKGANQALAAARAGAHVRMVGAVGDDGYDRTALHYLDDANVDLSGVDTIPGPTGLAAIQVSDSGENSIVVIAGANSEVDADFVTSHSDTITTSHAVLLQGEIPAEGIHTAIDIATSSDVRVVVNLAPVINVDTARLAHANPLIANEHEAREILALHGTQIPVDASFEDVARSLCAVGYASVAITLGERGAVVAESVGKPCDVQLTVIPTPTVSAVDTTGAGDAFAGALTAKIAGGTPLADAAAYAARFAAYTVQHPGAQSSYPQQDDILPS